MRRYTVILFLGSVMTLPLAAHGAPVKGVVRSMECAPISKGEYNAAKRQKLLDTRFSRYVRTGRVWRRYYWYCHR